jgi:histidine triad (HIT) family protein
MAPDCLFCRIVRQEIPARLVHQSNDCIAFRDIDPQAPVHVLVIPREHIASLNDPRSAAIVGQLAAVATEIARLEGIAESGYRTVINTNRDGGQTVSHLHLHLLGGRAMTWPPG